MIRRVLRPVLRRLRPRADRFLRRCNGVVHVGANTGQERELYASYGLTVIWVEALPSIYRQLVENIRPYPKQIAIRALLTDSAGELMRFYIAANGGASSSIFELALHKDIWPEVDYVAHVDLETQTLDLLLSGYHIDQNDIDALVLDTQGSELMVLKGSESLLKRVSYVKVEAADFEAYKNGTTVEAIERFLGGFSLFLAQKNEFARHPNGGGYYDLIFERS
jgi:FkbM family methyltransferase